MRDACGQPAEGWVPTRPSAAPRLPASHPPYEREVGRRRLRILVREARLRRREPACGRSRSSFVAAIAARRPRRDERRRGPSRLGRSLRLSAGGRVRPRRRVAVSGGRRPDPRGSEGVRVSAAARARARAADVPARPGRRRSSSRSACSRSSARRSTSSRFATCAATRRRSSGFRRSAASCSGTCRSRSRSRSRSSGDTATSVRPPAVALGLAVSAKLLLWPMFVWALATRRLRTAALARRRSASSSPSRPGPSSASPALAEYPDLLRAALRASSRSAATRSSGWPSTLGLARRSRPAATLVVGGALLVGCVVLARRGDEERSFTCAVAATLALSPIVWLHYLVLLLVPLAILRPRFSLLWLLPVLLWVSPRPGYAEGYETFMPGLVAADPRRRAARPASPGAAWPRPRRRDGAASAAGAATPAPAADDRRLDSR